jgi:uncharacterized protein YtpQ (UPF0354 family)
MGFWSKIFGGGQKASPEELFTQLCLDEVQRHPLVVRAERAAGDEQAVEIWKEGDGQPSQTIFLSNTFAETRELPPEEKREAIRRLLKMFDPATAEQTWDEAQGSLVPVLRIASFAWFGRGLLWWPFAPYLRTFIGIDHETSISYATPERLEKWQQDELLVLALALANLRAHVEAAPDCEPYDASAAYPIWHVTRDDSYEASRLALPHYLAGFRGKVNGTPIAIVPHRSLLVIAGDADNEAIARLAQMAEAEFAASTRPVSPAVYTIDAAGKVIPLRLPPAHPQHWAVERGHYLLAQTCHADQKKWLEERFEEEGTDVFVASFGLLTKNETGAIRSWGSMTKDVATLLPKTDLVGLNDLVEKPFLVPWEKVFELAPECFVPAPEFEPFRVRIVGWPAPAVLAELREQAFHF